jgi:hypothetical protein
MKTFRNKSGLFGALTAVVLACICSGALAADGPDLVAYFSGSNGMMSFGRYNDLQIGVKNIGNRATPSGTCIRLELTVSYANISSWTAMNAFRACDGNAFANKGVAGCQATESNKLVCEWDGLGAKDLPGDNVYTNDAWEMTVSLWPTRGGGTSFKLEADRPNRIREVGRETNVAVIPMTIR